MSIFPWLLGLGTLFGMGSYATPQYPAQPKGYELPEYPLYETPGTLGDILKKMAKGELTYPTEDIYRTMELRFGKGMKGLGEQLRRSFAARGALTHPSGLYLRAQTQLAQAGTEQLADIARKVAQEQEAYRRQAQQWGLSQLLQERGKEYQARLREAMAEQERLRDIFQGQIQMWLQQAGVEASRAASAAQGLAGILGPLLRGYLTQAFSIPYVK